MVAYKSLWIYLCIWYIIGSRCDAYLELVSNPDVSAIYQKPTELLCRIESGKFVKEVIWYKLLESGSRKIVYYFEPPKYNTTGQGYKGLVHLAKDSYSLVINSASRDDEGEYECHVAVVSNSNNTFGEIPEESNVKMKLTVYVPPNGIKLSTFLSGNNLTLKCRSSRSIPAATIEWIVTRHGISKTMQSDKVVTDILDNYADTIGYLYISLTDKDEGTTVECLVSHSETRTILKKNITMVPPKLEHPVEMYFDWLGFKVPYSSFESTLTDVKDSTTSLQGLVNMTVFPSRIVQPNSTVVINMTSNGSFPKPSYTWWSEDLDLKPGNLLRIRSLDRDRLMYCVVENPVGRIAMSVQLVTSSAADHSNPTTSKLDGEDIVVSGALVAGVAFGALIILLLISFAIYYFAFRVPRSEKVSEEGMDPNDFDSYVAKEKPPYSSAQPTGQTKVISKDRPGEEATSTEKESLLKSSCDSPDGMTRLSGDSPDTTKKRHYPESDASSNATSSGYGDDGGRNNDAESRPKNERSPSEKNRAINKHLNDFDENASFVGEYGSSFGIDGVDPPEEQHFGSRRSSYDDNRSTSYASDNESMDSGASGVEGRYTLPHHDSGSWENIDPNQRVGRNGRPSAI